MDAEIQMKTKKDIVVLEIKVRKVDSSLIGCFNILSRNTSWKLWREGQHFLALASLLTFHPNIPRNLRSTASKIFCKMKSRTQLRFLRLTNGYLHQDLLVPRYLDQTRIFRYIKTWYQSKAFNLANGVIRKTTKVRTSWGWAGPSSGTAVLSWLVMLFEWFEWYIFRSLFLSV